MNEPLPQPDKAMRLKEARQRRYKSAMKAAEAMGVPYGTYSGHEAGSRGFDEETTRRYAKFYRVPVEWLAFGTGSIAQNSIIPIVGLVGLGDQIQWNEDEHVHLGEVELPFPLPPGCFALEARGDSQRPRVKNGEIIVTRWHDGPVQDLLNDEAIVELVDKIYMLKVIRKGSEDGLFHLESHNADLISDAEIERAGPVMMIMPSRSWIRHAP